ncbi:MAG: septum formation initiator family protein [Sphingomonadales bacterium]
MSLLQELKQKVTQVAAPVFGALVIVYFGYHTIEGRYGLIALHQLRSEISELQEQARGLKARREVLEHRVAMLRPDNLDPDLLEEEVRKTLGFVHKDEIVIFP